METCDLMSFNMGLIWFHQSEIDVKNYGWTRKYGNLSNRKWTFKEFQVYNDWLVDTYKMRVFDFKQQNWDVGNHKKCSDIHHHSKLNAVVIWLILLVLCLSIACMVQGKSENSWKLY